MAKTPTLEQQLTEAKNQLAETQQKNQEQETELQTLRKKNSAPAPSTSAAPAAPVTTEPEKKATAEDDTANLSAEELRELLKVEREASALLANQVKEVSAKTVKLEKEKQTGEARAAQILAMAGHPTPLPSNPQETSSVRLKTPVAPLTPEQAKDPGARSAHNRSLIMAWCQSSVDLHQKAELN